MEQTIKVYLTQMGNNKKLQEQAGLRFEEDKPGNDGNEGNVLNVYDQVEYQEIMGFGGAFTQASAVNFMALSDSQRRRSWKLISIKKKASAIISAGSR